jgi:3-deoxy-manno-octulosonate cytidylyltransferase (CMP-KDO synthetase)
MKSVIIIPARLAASRFPNKPLAKINGVPMIGHCFLNANKSRKAHSVYVATPDREIFEYITSIGGKAIMTSKKHNRASDRAAEALLKIEKKIGKVDVVVMFQGDEPMITFRMIDKAIDLMSKKKKINVINLITKISSKEVKDINEIKVVKDKNDNAIYFSRLPIPYLKKTNSKTSLYKQVCVIPFRRNTLLDFNKMKESSLEKNESIDMLRLIENDFDVKLIYNSKITYSVDNLNDLKKVRKLMKR